ncbi:hypothetical protein FRB94_014292 [Tulasnella sp. JGI-2019a]|nr:hypothetical protein FRB93_000717 [Tulasnella sp. JGI-2019a]KAG9007523.1 hypothetical protein FRB94_014292 [Tulasnella sp. JGI-2019a]
MPILPLDLYFPSEYGSATSISLELESVTPPLDTCTAVSGDIWPRNIPPLELMRHLAETVFHAVPLSTRLIHRPMFMASLTKPYRSPNFPHVNLLHAICALASLYTPIITDLNPVHTNAALHEAVAATMSAGVVNRGSHSMGTRYPPRRMEDLNVDQEYDFASFHAKWCYAGLPIAVARDEAVVQQLQACILCTWYTHSRGKLIQAAGWSNFAFRILSSFGINASPGMTPLSRIPTQFLFAIPPAKSAIESELYQNIFWITYSMERVLDASNVWPLSIADEDCSQMMPCRKSDFEFGAILPNEGRQRLFSHGVFLSHPRRTTDSFALYIKAASLLGRVKTFNGRFRYRYTDVVGRDPSASPTCHQGSPETCGLVNEVTKINPRDTEEFKSLDTLIAAFIANVPREFNDPVGLDTGSKLDPTLYMAHMLPHMATIILHDPHANVFSTHDSSARKLLSAARAILELIYKVCGTSFDLLYLDHASSTPWFIAGVTLIRFLHARTAQKEEAEIARLTQELGAVRFMLNNLGERTGIGLRQIKLLDMVYELEMDSHSALTYLDVTTPVVRSEA